MENKELKEGDEVVLKLEVIYKCYDGRVCGIAKDSEEFIWLPPSLSAHLLKVRPGTYEVTARDVAKMMCRAMRDYAILACVCGKAHNFKPDSRRFKRLRRWVHCRLRELRRKRAK